MAVPPELMARDVRGEALVLAPLVAVGSVGKVAATPVCGRPETAERTF